MRNFRIATIAGSPYDPSGDNGPAANAIINLTGVAVRSGVVYLTDAARIRSISADGTIATIAGLLDPVVHQPVPGFSGDGGPASQAQFRGPVSLAFDSAGNLYIADSGNHCVRKITARVVGGVPQALDGTETISTVAGVGTVAGNNGDTGPATAALLTTPRGVTVDPASGTLYIADQGNRNVRKVDPAGTISTIGGSAVFFYPDGIAVDPVTSDVYLADVLSSKLFKIAASGVVTTFAGTGNSSAGGTNLGEGGPATAANVRPAKVVLVGGILYLVDSGIGMIRMIDTVTGIITTLAGSGASQYTGALPPVGDGGPALEGWLVSGPSGIQDVAIDDAHNAYIPDAGSRRLRFVANAAGATIFGQTVAGGNITTVAGQQPFVTFGGDGGPAKQARLYPGVGITFDPAGSLYLSDTGNNVIRRIEPPLTDPTRTIVTIAGNGTANYLPGPALAAEIQPGSLAFFAGNLYLTNNTVRVLEVSGGQVTLVANQTGASTPANGGPAITANLGAASIVFDSAGNLYVGDAFNNRIWKIDSSGNATTIAGGKNVVIDGVTVLSAIANQAKLFGPSSLAFDPGGNLYTTDGTENRILKITAGAPNRPLDGTETITIFAGTTGQFGFAGDGGPATAAVFNGPGGLVFDPSGNLYLSDGTNYRIREIDTSGMINTVAGNGVASFSGDGGPATSAEIRGGPLAFDSFGNLFLTDAVNNVVRVLDDSAPTVTFGTPEPAPNAHGWNNASVIVPFETTDTGSGVASTSPLTPLVLAAEGAAVSRMVTAIDRAGNSGSFASPQVKIDREPPVIHGMPAPGHVLSPADGRMIHVGTVTAADALSGVDAASFEVSGSSNEPGASQISITPNGSGGFDVALRAEHSPRESRVYTLMASASDLAGNTTTVTTTCVVPQHH